MDENRPEPWLRGTLTGVDALRRQVLHALELAGDDLGRWCADLQEEEFHARPFELASIAFQIRHIARSLDRLLSYAEGRQLSNEQMKALANEMTAPATKQELLAELSRSLEHAQERVLAIGPDGYEDLREVGRQRLPTTLGGLLIHCAEHTQRHVGQAITTTKVLRSVRSSRT